MRSGALFAALLSLAACPRRPFSFGPRGELKDPAEVMAALAARSAKLTRLRSEVSVSGKSSRGSGSTSGLVAAARPAQLRFELDDFFGNPAVVLTTDGQILGLYQAATNLFATGAASAENLAQFMPAELEFPEAVDLLFGDPRPLGARVKSFSVDRARYSYALLFETADREQRIDFDTESLLPVRVRVEGSHPYEARFSNPESASGLQLPQEIEIDSPRGHVGLHYKHLEVNPPLPANLFVPVSPPGAKARQLVP